MGGPHQVEMVGRHGQECGRPGRRTDSAKQVDVEQEQEEEEKTRFPGLAKPNLILQLREVMSVWSHWEEEPAILSTR